MKDLRFDGFGEWIVILFAIGASVFGKDGFNSFLDEHYIVSELVLFCLFSIFALHKQAEALPDKKSRKSLMNPRYVDTEKSDDTHITIREGITEIPSNLFKEMKHIVSVTIPDSVVKIADNAFMGCKSLRDVIIPDSVTNIGANAFSNCSSLKNIKLPASLTKIEEATFRYCFGLREIKIPDSVSAIDKFAFEDCLYLDSIAIPTSTTIDKTAFKGCVAIKDSAKATI